MITESKIVKDEYIYETNAQVKDLFLFDYKLDVEQKIEEVFEILNSNKSIPGIIITKESNFYGLIPRLRFFELMSKSYMLDMFSRRPISYLYEDHPTENILILPYYTLIVKAAETALLREEKFRNDPIVIEIDRNNYKILDVHNLLLAQTKIHMETMQSLRTANEFKDDVLHIAAHDLKSPLHAIIGFAEEIEELMVPPEQIKEYSEYISSSARNMLSLINELLESATIDNNISSLKQQEIDLSVLVEQLTKNFRKMAEKKGQRILLSIDKTKNYYIKADKIKINEAIENLLSNAIKYSPYQKNIAVSLVSDFNFVKVSIKDEGPGFSDKDMDKLFGKFQMLSAVPTGGESSTGLGLYIVKQIIDLHKGIIHLDSKPGEGSTFTIELPLF